MTPEEQDLIARFVARVGGAAPAGGGFGSVPGTAPALPPVDPAADRFIADQFGAHPEARYRITQMAFVQEAALVEAQNRIRRLEWELQQRQAAPQPQQGGGGRGLFGSLFGGGGQQSRPGYGQPQYQQPQYAPPPPQYPPGYQPGMFARQGGSGFLGSALTTAAGVAGGMVAGNALMSLFSHHEGGGGGLFGGGAPEAGGGFLPGADSASDPWAGAGVADPDPGGFSQPDPGQGGDPFGGGGFDPGQGGGFDQGGDPFGGDSGGGDPFGGGGFDSGGGDTWT